VSASNAGVPPVASEIILKIAAEKRCANGYNSIVTIAILANLATRVYFRSLRYNYNTVLYTHTPVSIGVFFCA